MRFFRNGRLRISKLITDIRTFQSNVNRPSVHSDQATLLVGDNDKLKLAQLKGEGGWNSNH